MKNLKKIKSDKSIDFFSKILLILVVMIMIINIFFSYLSNATIKQQNIASISNTIDIFANSLSKEMTVVDRFMYWTVLHDQTLDDWSMSSNHEEFITNLNKIRTRFKDFTYYNKVDYTFLIQTIDSNVFTNVSETFLEYSDYIEIKKFFGDEQNQETTPNNIWIPLNINSTEYLYRTIKYQNKIIHAVVSVNNILAPLNDMNIGSRGLISIAPSNDEIYSNKFINTHHLFIANKERTKLPFNIYVYVDYQNAFRNVVTIQFIMLLIPVIICTLSIFILMYTQKKVIKPIKKLSNRLVYSNDSTNIIFDPEGIIEIDNANVHITNIVKELQQLRIDKYELELKQKRVEINHLKNQIRPHFYLNILTMIHSMIQTNHYTEIEQLTLSTSKYLRYLFQINKDFIQLQDELSHIDDYLSIQKLRYGNEFEYRLCVDNELTEAKIPPLILQTFVENIFKHCFSLENNLKINISIEVVDDEKEFYKIVVDDNGPGIAEYIIDKLNSRETLITSEGHHVGLTNVMERLDLLYGNQYHLKFSKKIQGTKIQLLLPFNYQKGISNEHSTS